MSAVEVNNKTVEIATHGGESSLTEEENNKDAQEQLKEKEEEEEEEEEEEDNYGLFNPDLFTSHVELEHEELTIGRISLQLSFVHSSNQLLDKFVSRVIWPSATELSKWFESNPELVEGKRILELGSGTGLCGIVMAKLGAKQVVMTDYNESAVDLLQKNVEENGVQDKCSCLRLTWGDHAHAQEILRTTGGAKFDIVVGTDVVYENECVEPLLKSAIDFMDEADGRFYLANHTHRYGRLEATVKSVAAQLGLREEVLPSIVGEDGKIDLSIFFSTPQTVRPDLS